MTSWTQVEAPPMPPRREIDSSRFAKGASLHLSADQRFVWHLDVDGEGARVDLLDADTMDVRDSFRPKRLAYYDEPEGEHALEDWGDDTFVSVCEPDQLLVYANAGDDLALLVTLRGTSDGIADPVGTKLLRAARSSLDARIWGAGFVAPDRFVILGDVNDLTLLSWPAADELASVSVDLTAQGLTDEAMVDEGFAVVDGNLIVPVTDSGLVAMLALDPETLSVRRVISPPATSLDHLVQLEGNTFVALRGAERTYWTLR